MTSERKKRKLPAFEPKKKLRIIVLVHQTLCPDSLDGLSDKEKVEVKTEYDVISTLKKMGHDVIGDFIIIECHRRRADGAQTPHRV